MLVVKINHLTIVWFKARSPFVLKHTTSFLIGERAVAKRTLTGNTLKIGDFLFNLFLYICFGRT